MSKVTVVVPCYNEADRLDVEAFKVFRPDAHSVFFLFVNDGSADGTGGLLDKLHAEEPERFGALHLERNSGKAEAVRRGVLAALEDKPHYVGFWDADLATPLATVASFCEVLDARPETEMVFGSRVKLLGRRIERSAARHYLGRVFATVVSRTLRLAVYDTQCGAKLFRVTETLPRLFAEPFLSRWFFDVEILARLIEERRGKDAPQPEDVIIEYPLETWLDVRGTKRGIGAYFAAARDLLRIRWKYRL